MRITKESLHCARGGTKEHHAFLLELHPRMIILRIFVVRHVSNETYYLSLWKVILVNPAYKYMIKCRLIWNMDRAKYR